ncbi:MAG TPA: PAS domain S-box protein [Usitatibacter sp.]|nr:PAS domain S-box protein [Usitatibacter sp.]
MNDLLLEFLVAGAPVAIVAPLLWTLARIRRSEQRALRDARETRDRLNEALDGSQLAVFDWDVASQGVRLSPTWPVMLGGEAVETRVSAMELFSLLHPDDVQRVREAAAETLSGRASRYDTVHRVRRLDGTYFWCHSRGKVTARDARGRAVRFAGTNADVTARVAAEERLKEREQQLRQLIDTMPAAIAVFGTDERILFHNRAYRELTGLAAEAINGKRMREVAGDAAYGVIQPHVRAALDGRTVRFEQQLTDPGGRTVDLEVVYTPLHDDQGRVTAAITVRFDITRLKDLDRMKDGFVAVASHELRTPLTSMRGSLGLLQGGVAGELAAEARGLVSIAMQNCERLVRLVDDLLDLEKVTSGHGAFRIALLDWPTVLRQAIDSSHGFVESYGVAFELEPPPELRVRGDEDRLIQVLSNLLFNAAKFSPRGSVVTVSAKQLAESWVRTSVRDRGPGVPEHFRERIFQRFAQAHMGEDRPAEGSGLGLAISREIIERLGGHIGFDAAQGGGTVFWFDLPGTSEAATK